MIVTLTPQELQTLVAIHLRERFKGMVNHAGTEYVDVSFATPPPPLEATLEVKRTPRDERD